MTTAALPDDNAESLGIASALVRARAEKGITQADLAEQSGISRSAIKGYETGRNMPGARELRALCKVLRVSPNMLLFGTDQPFETGEPAADANPHLRLLLGDPEDQKRARLRLAMLGDLLTADEMGALLTLAHSLATARHGAEAVQKHVISADFMVAMSQALSTAAKSGGEGVDFQSVMEASLERGGHKPPESSK
jgi:transcriptional regulator with XRE-family HTH domain